MDGETPRMTRLQQRRGPKPAARQPRKKPRRTVEGLMEGGFSLDHSDKHLSNYHRLNPDSEADDLYFRMTRALVVAARRWRKVANDRLKPIEQTMAQWETLYLVAYSGEELNQSQLSRLLGVHGPTMLRMLDALSRRGLIERQQSHELRREVLAGIDAEDLGTAIKVLTQMLGALEKLDQGHGTKGVREESRD